MELLDLAPGFYLFAFPPGERKLRILSFTLTEFVHLSLLWLPLEGVEPFLSLSLLMMQDFEI